MSKIRQKSSAITKEINSPDINTTRCKVIISQMEKLSIQFDGGYPL